MANYREYFITTQRKVKLSTLLSKKSFKIYLIDRYRKNDMVKNQMHMIFLDILP